MVVAAVAGDTRHQFSDVFSVYVPVAIAVLLLVALALAVTLARDRAAAGHSASMRTRAPRVELAYVVGLVVVAALLAWPTLAATRNEARVSAHGVAVPGAGPRGLTVRAVAAKWNWRFEYPGGVVEQGRGPSRLPTLVVPSGGPVHFRLATVDVEHAMWIPAARYKYDAVPGRTNVFDIGFDPKVDYRGGRCSEFCGQYHAQMQFRVKVMALAAFRSWLSGRQLAPR